LVQQVNKKLSILFVADVSIANVIGGAERVLFEQSTRLAQREHNVHILTRRLQGHKQVQEVIQGVREWRYEVDQKSAISFIKSSQRNAMLLFERLHDRYAFDCINFHQPFSAFGVIKSPLSKKIEKIYTCHSLSFEEYKSRNPKPEGFLSRTLSYLNIHGRKRIEERVLKKSNAIVVLSRFTQNKILRAYRIPGHRITIIPGGIDLKKFHPASNKIEIRRRLKIPSGKVILFSVRNLVPRMGLENLIHALKEVVKNAPDIYLVLGGMGPLKDDLVSLTVQLGVEDLIRFTDFIPEGELPEYYRMADLFILPTIELEGFGLVTLESMASGVPVLGTPVGGTKEILGKFDRGFLFKGTSPDSMALLIAEKYRVIKEKPEDWKKISNRCRDFVVSRYSWKKNVDSLEKMFAERLEGIES